MEEFTRNEDGSLPLIKFTTKGVEPLQTLDPYVRQEAETVNQSSGILCVGDYRQCYVTNISSSGYIKVRNVDFGEEGALSFKARVRSSQKATLVVRQGSRTGSVKARVAVEPTDGEWVEVVADLAAPLTGVRDISFTFQGSGKSLFEFDSWQFSQTPTGVAAPAAERPATAAVVTCDLSGRAAGSDAPGLLICRELQGGKPRARKILIH